MHKINRYDISPMKNMKKTINNSAKGLNRITCKTKRALIQVVQNHLQVHAKVHALTLKKLYQILQMI